MNEDTAKDGSKKNNPVITAANAWIVCESKSRPGHKYYYNQTLGVPVWNLTDAEIAAAVAARNAGEKCVEPLGPPPGPPSRPTPSSRLSPSSHPIPSMDPTEATIFKKQIVNNQFSNQVSNMLLNAIPACNPYGVWDKPPLQSQQFQTAFSDINMNSGASLQQNFQQFLPSGLPNAGVPFSFNVHQPPQREMSKMQRNKKNKWLRRNLQGHQTHHMQYNYNKNNDLRQKIRRNRCHSGSFTDTNTQVNTTTVYSYGHEMIESTTRLDLLPLKTLTSSGSDSDQWHIVVDTDVLLNNYSYLDSIIYQDPDCHLVVPHHVLLELHAHASQENVLARRILRFLTHQIDSGLVIVGEEIEEGISRLKTITTCVEIALQNNHVVLISNNEEMLNYKRNKYGIHVFTMQDIKDILNNRPNKVHQRSVISPTRAIKIVVPNTIKNDLVSTKTNAADPIQPTDTDVPANNEKTETTNSIEKEGISLNPKPPESPKVDSESTTQETVQDPVNKREIRLKRTISKNTDDGTTEKKKFKWRKKRGSQNSSPVPPNPSSDAASAKILIDKQTGTERSSVKLQRTISNLTDSCSETTSKTSELNNINRRPIEGLVIAEKSSESISNSVSSIKSPSFIGYIAEKKVTIREPVMFQVACQSMEEVLKTRCDEWVSRFVQIMEEVLREKLQENPPFESKEYPPPWNLQEAARCVIKKFSDHFNVVDAANRLSFMLYKISDKHGKINLNIQPFEYMEMYSYGVYLVETLQDVNCNCEDLQTASGSLKYLLCDIQNANSASQHDTFADVTNHDANRDHQLGVEYNDFETSYYNEASESLFPEVEEMNFNNNTAEIGFPVPETSFPQAETSFPETETNLRTAEGNNQTRERNFHESIESVKQDDEINMYNLRSQNKIQTKNDEPQPKDPMISKDKEFTFFKCLNLNKTFHTNATELHKDDLQDIPNTPDTNSSPIKVRATSQVQTSRNTEAKELVSNVDGSKSTNENKVTISRIFIKKLQMKQNEDEDYYDNEVDDYEDELNTDGGQMNNNTGTETGGDDNRKLYRFIAAIGRKLKCAFAQVYVLCKNFVEECNIDKKTQLQDKIKEASVFLQQIYNSLDRMIIKEHYCQDRRFQNLLKTEQDFILHANKNPEFRDVITKSKRETELHLKVLRHCTRYSLQQMAQG